MTIKTAGGLLNASAREAGGGGVGRRGWLGSRSRAPRLLHSLTRWKKAARANSKIPTNTKKQHKKWFYHLSFLPRPKIKPRYLDTISPS